VSEKETRRDKIALEVKRWCNEHNNWRRRYFDCGDYGVLYLYWTGPTWEHRWIEIEPLPSAVGKLLAWGEG